MIINDWPEDFIPGYIEFGMGCFSSNLLINLPNGNWLVSGYSKRDEQELTCVFNTINKPSVVNGCRFIFNLGDGLIDTEVDSIEGMKIGGFERKYCEPNRNYLVFDINHCTSQNKLLRKVFQIEEKEIAVGIIAKDESYVVLKVPIKDSIRFYSLSNDGLTILVFSDKQFAIIDNPLI